MQTNKTTNVILGVIALALIVIIILLAIRKNPEPVITQNEPSVPINTQVSPTPISNSTNSQSSTNSSTQVYPLTAVAYHTSGDAFSAVVANAQTQPVNFAGHYEIVTARCGNGCEAPYLFDKNTNGLYSFPTIILNNTVEPDATFPQNYSVSGNTFTMAKVNSAGVDYTETWKLTSAGFVKM